MTYWRPVKLSHIDITQYRLAGMVLRANEEGSVITPKPWRVGSIVGIKNKLGRGSKRYQWYQWNY